MPIEFACEACAKLLRVPDGTGGSACQCPACGKMLEIPDPNRVEIVEVVEDQSPSDQQPSDQQSSDQQSSDQQSSDRLIVTCPKCSFELECSPELLGTKGQCRNCKYIFVISEDPEPVQEADQSQVTNWVFTCPSCDQLFEGQEEMQGRKGKCHECGEVFEIELKPADGPQAPVAHADRSVDNPAADSANSGSSTTAGSEPSSTPAAAPRTRRQPAAAASGRAPKSAREPVAKVSVPAANLQLACSSCNGVMEVPATAAGQTTVCPYCQQLLQIPLVGPSTSAGSTSATTQSMTTPSTPTRSNAASSWNAASQANPSLTPASQMPQPQDDIWSELGDMSRAASGQVNPYESSQASWESSNNSLDMGVRKPVRRKLTFQNAFGLVFDNLFPSGLMGMVVLLIMIALNLLVNWGMSTALAFSINPTQMDPTTRWVVAIVALVLVTLVNTCVSAAGMCMLCNGALAHVRSRKTDAGAFFVTDAFPAMFGYLLILALAGVAIGAIPSIMGPEMPGLTALALMFAGLFCLVAAVALSLTPIAIVDGYGSVDGMAASVHLFFTNFPVMIGVLICGILLYLAVSVISCGLLGIVFVAFPYYLLASLYHLANR